jgi:hypothetical protein
MAFHPLAHVLFWDGCRACTPPMPGKLPVRGNERKGAALQESMGWGRAIAVLGLATLARECRDLAESERDQTRAKQHEACCGHCEESFGYEIIVTHDAPADRDAGPNLLKLSESLPLQHRPRTIALISVSNENAGADEAE